MTPFQLEAAARRLCELRKEDPDQEIINPYSTEPVRFGGHKVLNPRWRWYTTEIVRAEQVQEALAYGQNAVK